ncbi:MAG: SHOCT domain-containing protein [Solirubrobacterales bacterium]
MPGLIRGVARTAVIAGTATHVSNNVSRRQAQRWSEQEQQQYAQPAAPVAAAPAPAAPAEDPMEQLQKLGDLKAQGILTEEEFQAQKAKILAQ